MLAELILLRQQREALSSAMYQDSQEHEPCPSNKLAHIRPPIVEFVCNSSQLFFIPLHNCPQERVLLRGGVGVLVRAPLLVLG